MINILKNLLEYAENNNASDIHFAENMPGVFRVNGNLTASDGKKIFSKNDINELMTLITDDHRRKSLKENGEIDFSFSFNNYRIRTNIYKYRCGQLSISMRIIPNLDLKYPNEIKELALLSQGLVLITGPASSGKSTTLATMINLINQTKEKHIITLENPIEYMHQNNKSIIKQREISIDSKNFNTGLRAALREDPDVIMIGEFSDEETIAEAIVAAENGHLILGALSTANPVETIDKIIDMFPEPRQMQIRNKLAITLRGIISQRLYRSKESRRLPAFEILVATQDVSNLIRQGKTHQIISTIKSEVNLI